MKCCIQRASRGNKEELESAITDLEGQIRRVSKGLPLEDNNNDSEEEGNEGEEDSEEEVEDEEDSFDEYSDEESNEEEQLLYQNVKAANKTGKR